MSSLPLAQPLESGLLHDAWLPQRSTLVREDRESDLRVRVHRACKALEQAEAIEAAAGGDESAGDVAFVLRWVALNALYGRWDFERGMPQKDRVAVDEFTSEACRVDAEGRVLASLRAVADDGKELLANPFLVERFWKDPEWEQVRPNKRRAAEFRNELLEERPSAALQRLLMSVYFLRCQIVHGGATLGSGLNRVTVVPARRILGVLSSQLLALVVEHGLEMEWGPLNYPPVRDPEEDERG